MPYLTDLEKTSLSERLIESPEQLRKEYLARRSSHDYYTCSYSRADELIKEGWSEFKRHKTKIRLSKEKKHDIYFEDQIWCLFYELGFTQMNVDRNFSLKYGIEDFEKQQIDVIAINDEMAFVIECKSSQKLRSYSYKSDFESLSLKKDGFIKSIKELVGPRKIKYVFATRNQILGKTDTDRLKKENCFHLDDKSFSYMKILNTKYKGASKYQILATFFRGEKINNNSISVPAIKGKMGGKVYYMFSIEPEYLLQIGFVSHRTRANSLDVPTYQRLIVPSRIRALNNFLDNEKGFFPNSVILNFKPENHKLRFDSGGKDDFSTNSQNGVLHIPNVYALAYIIDGQHRIYGYADSIYKNKNTIPVVAFEDLSSEEQLKMFLDINENQKAISKGLRLTLQEDVNWGSPILKNKITALSSAIINKLGSKEEPLKSLLSIGEDKAVFSPDNFDRAFQKGGLLPSVDKKDKNKFITKTGSLFDVRNTVIEDEMDNCVKRVTNLVSLLYSYLNDEKSEYFNEEHKLFFSNRANYALVFVLSEINAFITNNGYIDIDTKAEDRWNIIKPYFETIFKSYPTLNSSEIRRITSSLGQGAEGTYSMFLLYLINQNDEEFSTPELELWKETQDNQLQNKGEGLLREIEATTKKIVFKHLHELYDDEYEFHVPDKVVDGALARAKQEMRKVYNEEEKKVKIGWEEMLTLINYHDIIKNNWVKKLGDEQQYQYRFQDLFSFDVEGEEQLINNKLCYKVGKVSSKDKGLSWLVKINSQRNKIAHRATRASGLNKDEILFIEKCHNTIMLVHEEYS